MHRPNPVSTIAQQRQDFSTRQIQQRPVPVPMFGQLPAEPDIQGELAMEIYAKMAVDYMGSLIGGPDVQHLKDLAGYSKVAAQAFCEEGTSNG